MSSGAHPPGDDQGDLSSLVDLLHETYTRIREIAGEGADAIVHSASGTMYLLPDAQRDLRRMEHVERHYATERAAILDALPAQIALLDADGGIAAINEGWRRFAIENDLDDQDAGLGRNYLNICETARGPHSEEAGEVADGIRAVLAGKIRRYTLEYPCHSWQEKRWFLLTATPLNENTPSGAVVMHIDISDRVKAQMQADELRNRLERLIDQASVGILVHRNFVPVLVNRETARQFGFEDPDDVLALGDCRQLFAEDELARVEGYNAARLKGLAAPEVYRVTGRRRDGAPLVLENRAFTIKWDDEMAVCAMMTDITRQSEIEDQLRQAQRLEAVGQLTGGVAHDFNNLLTVILGNAELLAESLTGDSRLHMLSEMTIKAAERGAELTDRLLAFARRQPLDPRAVDINRRIADMDGLLRRTLGEYVEIEMVQAAGLWQAMIDPGQLENALLNLAINARDAMPEGGRLTIETANAHLDAEYAAQHTEVIPGQYVVIAVSDTGKGMDAETLERAFEPFFTTKEVGKGSGLGLSMVYGFVKQSNGHIRIYSEPGQGTTVRLYLPRADAGSDVAADGEWPDGAQVAQGCGRILVVEDDELVREHVSSQLVGLGYKVVAVGSGPEALRVLQDGGEFDLLFTDVIMPGGMTGGQLAEEVNRLLPDLPILFTSGYAENAIVHHGRLDRGVHLLQKPYRRQDLATQVRQALAKGGIKADD